jgi:hypothetical protein
VKIEINLRNYTVMIDGYVTRGVGTEKKNQAQARYQGIT